MNQQELYDQIKTLAEEFRLKAHLASMDAKTLWEEELQPKLKDLDARFDEATRDIEVSEDLKEMERKLRKVVDDLIEPRKDD